MFVKLCDCVGDLKLVEKPSPLTLAPYDFANIKANVKVASTENGIIFGNIGMYVCGFIHRLVLSIIYHYLILLKPRVMVGHTLDEYTTNTHRTILVSPFILTACL